MVALSQTDVTHRSHVTSVVYCKSPNLDDQGILPAGGTQLLVAAGKTAGMLLTCSLSHSNTATASDTAEISCSPVHVQKEAHGSRQVTGLAWASTQQALQSAPGSAPDPQQLPPDAPANASTNNEHLVGTALGLHATAQEGEEQSPALVVQPLLVSSGADGQIRLWQHSPAGLSQRNSPAAWSRPSLQKDQAFRPLGVAVSGNELTLAVAVDNGTAASAAVQYVPYLPFRMLCLEAIYTQDIVCLTSHIPSCQALNHVLNPY